MNLPTVTRRYQRFPLEDLSDVAIHVLPIVIAIFSARGLRCAYLPASRSLIFYHVILEGVNVNMRGEHDSRWLESSTQLPNVDDTTFQLRETSPAQALAQFMPPDRYATPRRAHEPAGCLHPTHPGPASSTAYGIGTTISPVYLPQRTSPAICAGTYAHRLRDIRHLRCAPRHDMLKRAVDPRELVCRLPWATMAPGDRYVSPIANRRFAIGLTYLSASRQCAVCPNSLPCSRTGEATEAGTGTILAGQIAARTPPPASAAHITQASSKHYTRSCALPPFPDRARSRTHSRSSFHSS
ncbi:hypothetical protein FA95DRAFT_1024378 [Auriscalpium vulgare]|uniref:Uncharacterized protein n=1 Tax=Auriscalpium vulgare TaxID=40419 RepID=A0ACB8RXH9_9AGAM|nr:hypothetical protein FA95DRAFT_1024378 [Auriscalpium vulgare]